MTGIVAIKIVCGIVGIVSIFWFIIWANCILPDKITYKRRQKYANDPWLVTYYELSKKDDETNALYCKTRIEYEQLIKELHEKVLYKDDEYLKPLRDKANELERLILIYKKDYETASKAYLEHINNNKKKWCYFF